MIIEIVGVAGAGKTTLTEKLCSSTEGMGCRNGIGLSLRRNPLLLCRALLVNLMPVLRHSRSGYRLHNLKMAMHMEASVALYERHLASEQEIYVYDQGVAYNYASFCYFGFESPVSPFLRRFGDRILGRYLRSLGAVVYLAVAPDVSVKRVRERPAYHMMNDFDPALTESFLAYYIEYYESFVDKAKEGGVPVLEMDAGQNGPESVLAEVEQFLCRVGPDSLPNAGAR